MSDKDALATVISPIHKSLPAIIANGGRETVKKYYEFLTVPVRNKNTRSAYRIALERFFDWCARHGFLYVEDIEPIHVAAYIEAHPGSLATKKQHMAAIRQLFSYLTEKGTLSMNPAREVKTATEKQEEGKRLPFSVKEVRTLLASIDTREMIGLRDHAFLATLAYTFARVGAVVSLKVGDYNARKHFLFFREKGNKQKRIPVSRKLQSILNKYLERSGLKTQLDRPLFPTIIGRSGRLSNRPMSRFDGAKLLKRRLPADIKDAYTPHSFRVTGITNYLENGGTLEGAQRIAGHSDPRTTKLYDRRVSTVAPEEMEKVSY